MAFYDKYGVEYSDDRETLVKCPENFKGKYEIPKGVITIGESAFSNCEQLSSINLCDSVEYILDYAFWGCKSLVEITIPQNVTYIGASVFECCDRLSSIVLLSLHSSRRCFYDTIGPVLEGCSTIKTLVINAIPPFLDEKCYFFDIQSPKLSVVIGEKVNFIPDGMFDRMDNIESITFLGIVTKIGKNAFRGCQNLSTIILPNGLKEIDESAFENCINLQSVSFPLSIERIADRAFADCDNLRSIIIPKNETTLNIGNEAFSYCQNLYKVQFQEDSVIGMRVFEGCSSLTSLTLPYATYGVCRNCINLENVELTSMIRGIGAFAFEGCFKLSSVSMRCNNINYKIHTDEKYPRIGKFSFHNCFSLSSFKIPYKVKEIGNMAFAGCRALETIEIPKTLQKIGLCAFEDCSLLDVIDIPDCVKTIGKMAFKDCKSLKTITVPKGVTIISDGMFYNCEALESVILHDHVIKIGCESWEDDCIDNNEQEEEIIDRYVDGVFEGCVNLSCIDIPERIKYIGNDAFKNCVKLSSISIPLTKISTGIGIFRGCIKLPYPIINNNALLFVPHDYEGKYMIPKGIKKIASYAFYDCSNLTEIVIPNSVTSIEESAFSNCVNLTSIYIPSSVIYIGRNAFDNCKNLQNVVLPNGVNHISMEMFANCQNLITLIIPEGVIKIEERAFANCNNLKAIIIPESLTSIESRAFEGCKRLSWITIPHNVSNLGTHIFKDCSSISTIVWNPKRVFINSHRYFCSSSEKEDSPFYDIREHVRKLNIGNEVEELPSYLCCDMHISVMRIPRSLQKIGFSCFSGCTKLESVIIPDGIMEIDPYTFHNCTSLKKISLPNNLRFRSYTFETCENLTTIIVNIGQKNFYEQNLSKSNESVSIVEQACRLPYRYDKCYIFELQQKRPYMTTIRLLQSICPDGMYSNIKEDIHNLLSKKRINCFYHFTSRKNIEYIKQLGGLFSLRFLEEHYLDVPCKNSDLLPYSMRMESKLNDYVHLSFCKDDPIINILKRRFEDIVILKISPEVALLRYVLFSNMSPSDEQHIHGKGLDVLHSINYEAIHNKYICNSSQLSKFKQAEVMVKTFVPLKYILNIDNV